MAGAKLRRVRAVDEAGRDPQLRERPLEEVVGPAVQAGAADDVVAGPRQVEDRRRLGRLAGGEGQGADAALQGRDAGLEDARGRVHDPGVDVPELLQGEEPGGVVGVVEDVRRGGVDRDGPRVRRGVGALPGVDGKGLRAVLRLVGHRSPPGHAWLEGRSRGRRLRRRRSASPSRRRPGFGDPAALPGERKSRSPCWTAAPGPDPGSRDQPCRSIRRPGPRPPRGGAAGASASTRRRS